MIGVRTDAVEHLRPTLVVFILDLDSGLVFVGDEGTTEAGPASRRIGIEFANHLNHQPPDQHRR